MTAGKQMRGWTVGLCALVVWLVAAPGHDQARAAGIGRPEINIGGEAAHVHYDEPDVMEEKGLLYGLFGSLSFNMDKVMVDLYMSYVQGDLKYDGGLQKTDPQTGRTTVEPLELDTPNNIINLRGVAGMELPLDVRGEVTPYVGLGRRMLTDDLPGEGGYKREQMYFYVPLGVQYELDSSWRFRAEYDLFLKGKNQSDDIELEQDKGSGFRFSGRWASRHVPSKPGFSVEAFFQYWSVDDSDTETVRSGGAVYSIKEPENTSKMFGVRAGLTL